MFLTNLYEAKGGELQPRAVHMGRWGGELPEKHAPKKNSSSVNHCSKFIFNNVIVTLTIYSFCRHSDYFWSVDIKLIVAILVEFKGAATPNALPAYLAYKIVNFSIGNHWFTRV
jgi:hypothetical protein